MKLKFFNITAKLYFALRSPPPPPSPHQEFWLQKEEQKQEDHDGPISLTWANSFAYLLLKFQPSSLL